MVINESVVDKIVNAVIQKIINVKYAKYFKELRSNPEYQEALQGLKYAADRIDMAAKAHRKSKAKWQKEYDEYVAEYGKAATDAMISKFYKGLD